MDFIFWCIRAFSASVHNEYNNEDHYNPSAYGNKYYDHHIGIA